MRVRAHRAHLDARPQTSRRPPRDHRGIVGTDHDGGAMKGRPCAVASASSAPRMAAFAATPPLRPAPSRRPIDRSRAVSGRSGNRSPPPGTTRQCLRVDGCRRPARAARRFSGRRTKKCGSAEPINGRGSGTDLESPASAARSTAGPPGKPRPSNFAVLSKASPAASSIVVARRR